MLIKWGWGESATLVILELIVRVALQHLVDFDDVGVGFGAQERIARAIEAEDETPRTDARHLGRVELISNAGHHENGSDRCESERKGGGDRGNWRRAAVTEGRRVLILLLFVLQTISATGVLR